MKVSFVQDSQAELDTFLAHKTIKTEDAKNKPRFLCTMCGRSGSWPERSRFLKFSCAGKPESKSRAVRRQRIQQERQKQQNKLSLDASPIPLGERAIAFSDAFRSVLRHCKLNFHPLEHATSVCRALKGHSLPPTAGLFVRPILLCQNTISHEISQAARCFHIGEWDCAAQWHLSWFPEYDKKRPDPLWRPREPD